MKFLRNPLLPLFLLSATPAMAEAPSTEHSVSPELKKFIDQVCEKDESVALISRTPRVDGGHSFIFAYCKGYNIVIMNCWAALTAINQITQKQDAPAITMSEYYRLQRQIDVFQQSTQGACPSATV